MGTTLIPKDEVRPPFGGWRYVCNSPSCKGKMRWFEPTTGVEASIFGRYIILRCKTCGTCGVTDA